MPLTFLVLFTGHVLIEISSTHKKLDESFKENFKTFHKEIIHELEKKTELDVKYMNVSARFRSSSEGEAGAGPALGGAALARLRARGDLPLFTWRQQMRMEPGVGYVHECIRPTRFLWAEWIRFC